MRYDFVIPLGQWCVTASYLNNFGLRKCSLPFDWLLAHGVSFGSYIDIIVDEFANFMREENLVPAPDHLVPVPDHETQYYDKGTGMISLHDFAKGVPFPEMQVRVRAKLARRIARLLGILRSARRILFVQCVQQGRVDDSDLRDGMAKIQAKYSNVIFEAVVLQHDEGAAKIVCDRIARGVRVYRGRFFGKDGDFVMGNRRMCERVFRRIKVKGQWINLVKHWLKIHKLGHIVHMQFKEERK